MATEDRWRDPVTGQYAFQDNWDRMCRCGHTLGAHVAGGFDCLNGNAAVGPECDGTPCDCRKFRPKRTRKPTKATE